MFKKFSKISNLQGPGMEPCLRSCALAGRSLAAALSIPSIGVHHMAAHALTPFLTEDIPPQFPFLTLLVSGGHTMIVLAKSTSNFKILATTTDTSIGDCFDKIAKALELPWNTGNRSPGAALEALAMQATNERVPLPRMMPGKLAFSYV